jgi:hypothetical protein
MPPCSPTSLGRLGQNQQQIGSQPVRRATYAMSQYFASLVVYCLTLPDRRPIPPAVLRRRRRRQQRWRPAGQLWRHGICRCHAGAEDVHWRPAAGTPTRATARTPSWAWPWGKPASSSTSSPRLGMSPSGASKESAIQHAAESALQM